MFIVSYLFLKQLHLILIKKPFNEQLIKDIWIQKNVLISLIEIISRAYFCYKL